MTDSTRVIVVNYNAGDALQRCVASVLASREALHLIVADNDSTDGSCERLRSLYASNPRIEILENGSNLGFASAVNACAAVGSEPYLLILNPDCELYPGALGKLKLALESDPDAALAAPCVVDRNENIQRGTLRHFPDPWKAITTSTGLARLGRVLPFLAGVESAADELPCETVRADAVSGACMLIRREDFARCGGFDERFQMHFEDLDLMFRLKQTGRHRLYVPSSRVFHQPGTSSSSRPWWVHRQKHLGLQRYFDKHRPGAQSAAGRWSTIVAIWAHYLVTLPLVMMRR